MSHNKTSIQVNNRTRATLFISEGGYNTVIGCRGTKQRTNGKKKIKKTGLLEKIRFVIFACLPACIVPKNSDIKTSKYQIYNSTA